GQLLQGGGERGHDVLGGHGHVLRHAVDEVATADLDLPVVLGGHDLRGAYRALDLLGGAVADQQVVLGLDVGHDVAVERVAGDAQALGGDDPAHAEHGDVGGAAADVDDHGADGLGDVDARADRARHRLLDEE